MVLENAKKFMKGIRSFIECEDDATDEDCCEEFIADAKEEIKYKGVDSEGALISPEWEGEYEVYQDEITKLYQDINKCERVIEISKEIGVGSLEVIQEDDWMEYVMEKSQQRARDRESEYY